MTQDRNHASWVPSAGLAAVVAMAAIGGYVAVSTGEAGEAPSPTPQQSAAGPVAGSITEVLSVPGYTYVEVDTEGGKVWAAAPSVSVKIGDEVSFATTMPMHGFYSKTLEREFSVIYFVDRFVSAEGATSISQAAADVHGWPDRQSQLRPVADVPAAEGGYTIAQVYAQRDELQGRNVRVRGKVYRFTPNVLNANWVRLIDGSTAENLLVSTAAEVAVDDVILVEGRIELNRDLGQGYVIPVILEDSHVK